MSRMAWDSTQDYVVSRRLNAPAGMQFSAFAPGPAPRMQPSHVWAHQEMQQFCGGPSASSCRLYACAHLSSVCESNTILFECGHVSAMKQSGGLHMKDLSAKASCRVYGPKVGAPNKRGKAQAHTAIAMSKDLICQGTMSKRQLPPGVLHGPLVSPP